MKRVLAVAMTLASAACATIRPHPARAKLAEVPTANSPLLFRAGPPREAHALRLRVPRSLLLPDDARMADESSLALDAFRTFLAPGSWDGSGRTAYMDGGVLVLRNSPEVLARVPVLLGCLAAARQRLIAVEARLLNPRPAQFADIENLRPRGGALVGVFDAAQLDRLLDDWGHGDGPSMTPPRMTLFPAQLGTVSVTNQLAYVAGYEKQQEETSVVWDPIVGLASEGVLYEVGALAADGRGRDLLVRVSLKLMGLLDCPPSVPSLGFGGHGGRAEIPRWHESRWSDLVALSPDQALLVVLPDPLSRDPERPFLAIRLRASWAE